MLHKTARDRFEHRQTKTLLETRYLGVAQDYDDEDKPVRAAKGISARASALLNVAHNAMRQSSYVGKNILKVWDDPNLNDATRVTRTATLAKATISSIAQQHNQLLEEALNDAKVLRGKIEKIWQPPSSAGQAAIDGELRAMLRGMSDSDRLAAVRRDPALLAAAARAPGLLSGLTDDAHKAIRHEYAAKIEPELVAEADDLEASIWTAEGAVQALIEDLNGITDLDSAATLQSKSTADLAA